MWKIIKKNKLFYVILLSIFLVSCKDTKKTDMESAVTTFTFYSSDNLEPLYFNDVIAKEITKRTGVTLDIQYRKNDENDDLDLMIVNGSFPDLIYAKAKIAKLIEAGAVIPLDSYIEESGDNIKKLYGNQIVKLRNSLEDPRMYTVGTYEIHPKVMETSGTLQLQNAVLREFGYPKIKTLDDFEKILIAYKKKYPVINGHKTIGLSLLTESWYWYVGLSNIGNYIIGLPDDGQWIVDQKTLKASYKFLVPEMKIFYKWLNKLYKEDLLDPESFTQDKSLWESKMQEGYVLSTSVPYYFIQDVQKNIAQNGNEQRSFAYLPVMADENTKDSFLRNVGFSGGWGIAISKDCLDKEKAFKFLDWMCSEEALILTNWGIENQDFYYDDNKTRISFSYIDNERGIGKWLYPFPEPGAGYIDSTGNPLVKQSEAEILKIYNNAEKETLAAYGCTFWTDLCTPESEHNIPKHGQVWQYTLPTHMTTIVNDVDNIVKKSLIKMITSDQNEFDKNWKKMNDEIIQMGIKDIETEISKLIQEKIQLWNN